MLIKRKKSKYDYQETRTRIKFAVTPIKLRQEYNDETGDYIWLEKYVLTEKYFTSLNVWLELKVERYSQKFIDALSSEEDDANQKKL